MIIVFILLSIFMFFIFGVLRGSYGVRVSVILIVVLFVAWVFWIAKGFDIGILLYISGLCGCSLMLGRIREKNMQKSERRKELEQQEKEREQQEKEREQQRVTQLRAKYGNSLPQLSTSDGKAIISEYLTMLPGNSTGKTCTEIVHEVLPECIPQQVSAFCRLLMQDGLIDLREVEGKAHFFSLIKSETEESRQNIYRQLEQQEQERKREEETAINLRERREEELYVSCQQKKVNQIHEEWKKQEQKRLEQQRRELEKEAREREKRYEKMQQEQVHAEHEKMVDAFGLEAIDIMDGHQFEHYCASLLRKLNFIDVEVTKGSGDQGVDIIAVKEGVRYAIQCKCYSSSLGNSPIQEVNAGKQLYGCHVAVVLTNQHFTSGAKILAAATGVLLWDREELERMIKKAGAVNG